MSNNGGLNVTIFPTHVRVPNGLGSFKNVTLKDFNLELARVLEGNDQGEQPKLAFRLPNETRSIRFNQHEVELLMYFPETIRTVRYSSQIFEIPFPATVIKVLLKSNGRGGWTVETVKWLCTDYQEDDIPNIEDWNFTPGHLTNHLWVLPLPNQYGDGGMCIGANSYRSLYEKDLRGLNELFYHILIGSPFNDDLWGTGARGLRLSGSGVRSWFTLLSKEKTFPWHRMPGYPQVAADEAGDENYALNGDEEEDDE